VKCLAAFLVLLLAGCGLQRESSAEKLDRIIASHRVDSVVLASLSSTNIVTGSPVQRYVEALSYTNRTAPSSNTAHLRLVTRVSLMSGTRQVALLSQYDTGEWQCGDVFFRLAVSP